MTIKNLSNTPFEIIIDCFLESFKNYFVELPTDKEYYAKRWKAAKVDFRYSYGMFDDEKLVGFIIHAVYRRKGKLTAFNTGTGVLPAYRGRRIVKEIYTHALQDLRNDHFELSSLEVIKENEIAIRSYEGIGFKKTRDYQCFGGEITISNLDDSDLEEIPLKEVRWNTLPNQELYSWDNQKESIGKGPNEFYYVVHNGQRESFFIINRQLNYLSQMDVLTEDSKVWSRLLAGIKTISNVIKINNVDSRLHAKQEALYSAGLKNTVDQFEMELEIVSD